jgi:RNA polymerase sigma-70 factor (ECF subfamily)
MIEIDSTVPADIILLEKIKNGDQTAFNILFEKYWEFVYSNAFKRLKNKHDAEDIVQEIFTNIWLRRASLTIHNLPAYLHVAVRNQVFKTLAKQKNISFFFLPENAEEPKKAEADLLWKEFFDSYQALLKTLPPKRQEIFRMRYDEDFSTKEIADKLSISRKTVQNQIGKALEALKLSLLHILFIVLLLS